MFKKNVEIIPVYSKQRRAEQHCRTRDYRTKKIEVQQWTVEEVKELLKTDDKLYQINYKDDKHIEMRPVYNQGANKENPLFRHFKALDEMPAREYEKKQAGELEKYDIFQYVHKRFDKQEKRYKAITITLTNLILSSYTEIEISKYITKMFKSIPAVSELYLVPDYAPETGRLHFHGLIRIQISEIQNTINMLKSIIGLIKISVIETTIEQLINYMFKIYIEDKKHKTEWMDEPLKKNLIIDYRI